MSKVTIFGKDFDPTVPSQYFVIWGLVLIVLMVMVGFVPRVAIAVAIGILLTISLMLYGKANK